jgi:hypothetical protein
MVVVYSWGCDAGFFDRCDSVWSNVSVCDPLGRHGPNLSTGREFCCSLAGAFTQASFCQRVDSLCGFVNQPVAIIRPRLFTEQLDEAGVQLADVCCLQVREWQLDIGLCRIPPDSSRIRMEICEKDR